MLIKPIVRLLITISLALLVAPLMQSSATALDSISKPSTDATSNGGKKEYLLTGKIFLNGNLASRINNSNYPISIYTGGRSYLNDKDGTYSIKVVPSENDLITFCNYTVGDLPYNTNSTHCSFLDTSKVTTKISDFPLTYSYDFYFKPNPGKTITGSITSPNKKINGSFTKTVIQTIKGEKVIEGMNVFGNRYQISIPSDATRISFCQAGMDCIGLDPKSDFFNSSKTNLSYNLSFKKNQAQKAATELAKSLDKVWGSNVASKENTIKPIVKLAAKLYGVTIKPMPFYKSLNFYEVIGDNAINCLSAKIKDKKIVYSVINSDCQKYITELEGGDFIDLLEIKLYLFSPLAAIGKTKYTPELLWQFGDTVRVGNLKVCPFTNGIYVYVFVGHGTFLESFNNGKAEFRRATYPFETEFVARANSDCN